MTNTGLAALGMAVTRDKVFINLGELSSKYLDHSPALEKVRMLMPLQEDTVAAAQHAERAELRCRMSLPVSSPGRGGFARSATHQPVMRERFDHVLEHLS